jgi:hypothetical protein
MTLLSVSLVTLISVGLVAAMAGASVGFVISAIFHVGTSKESDE